ALGPGAVAPQVLLGLGVVALGLLDVLAQFPGALANVLNGLFGTRHFGADGVELALGGVEAVALVGVAGAEFFQGVVAAAALGDQGLDVQLLAGDQGLAALQLGVELAPAQGLELGLGLALLLLEFGVLFGGLGLALEALELAPQLVADVGEALEVLLGAAHAVLGVAAAPLVLGNAGGLLDEHPQVLRAGLDQVGDHALLDDGVAAGPKAGAEEDVGDVPAPALVAVEVVAGLAVSGDLAADGDLGVAGVLAAEGAVAVVEDELDGGLAHRFAAAGAVEDDVGHRFAPQVLGGAFAHHPAHGVDDVGFAAPVGAHNRAQIA